MITDVLLLLAGIAMLILGGRGLVDGAARLAGSLGVSEVAIGMTVVAFGTSAPELAVNVLSALRGSSAIAFGNVVGSNLANVGLVLGLASLLRPLRIESVIVTRELPMMVLATAAALILGLDGLADEPGQYDRSDGLMLLLLFSVFLYYSIAEVLAKRSSDPLLANAAERMPSGATGRAGVVAGVGLVVLLVGAEVTVSRAVVLAEALGVSRGLIGLTIVAVGTSLPELVTSLVATWKGQTSLAVANVVGSNIFNLLFVFGTAATIRPIDVPTNGGGADLVAMTVLAAVLLPLSRIRGAQIVRWQGSILLAAYFAYLAWRIHV